MPKALKILCCVATPISIVCLGLNLRWWWLINYLLKLNPSSIYKSIINIIKIRYYGKTIWNNNRLGAIMCFTSYCMQLWLVGSQYMWHSIILTCRCSIHKFKLNAIPMSPMIWKRCKCWGWFSSTYTVPIWYIFSYRCCCSHATESTKGTQHHYNSIG